MPQVGLRCLYQAEGRYPYEQTGHLAARLYARVRRHLMLVVAVIHMQVQAACEEMDKVVGNAAG